MATRYEIMKLIREGKSPEHILARFRGQMGELRRVLSTRAFRRQLEAERELAAMVTSHRTAAGIGHYTDRLTELANGPNAETARKACLALLNEGMQLIRYDRADTEGTAATPAELLEEVGHGRAGRRDLRHKQGLEYCKTVDKLAQTAKQQDKSRRLHNE